MSSQTPQGRLCSKRKIIGMQYHFFLVPAADQFGQKFAEGNMPIIRSFPQIGDKIEYGDPAIPATVVDREIRFHGASSTMRYISFCSWKREILLKNLR
jgi:hypothetical protein